MAQTNPDITLTTAWTDLATVYPALSNAAAYVQCKAGYLSLLVCFSDSAAPPIGSDGIILSVGQHAIGTAPHIWVRSTAGSVSVQCGTTD